MSGPLSAGQRRIWFLQTRDPGDTSLTTCAVYRLTGPLDADGLCKAVADVAQENEILCSTYVSDADGEPHRVVRPEAGPAWTEVDISELSPASRARRLEVLIRREAGRPFDLAAESVLRCLLIRRGAEEFTLVLVVHAIGWDEGSWTLFCDAVSARYNGVFTEARGDQVPRNPEESGDGARGEDSALVDRGESAGETEVFDHAGIEYWRRMLRPLPQPLELPGRAASAGAVSPRAARCRRELPREVVVRTAVVAQELNASVFDVLLAVYALVVHRYTAAADFLVSVPISMREGHEKIGHFGNVLLLRTVVRPGEKFTEFAAAVRDTVAGAVAHRAVGIDRVVRAVDPDRSGARDGLEQLVRAEFAVPATEAVFGFDGVDAELVDIGSASTRIPLSLGVFPDSGTPRVQAEYQADLLGPEIVEQFLGHYVRLLDNATAAPHRTLGELDMFGDGDRAGLLEISHGELVEAENVTLVELFARRVAATPQATAIIAASEQDREYTYAELDQRSNRLAHWLIGRRIGPEDIVGIRLGASVEFVVAVLAVLKAGAAYLPIDPADPERRIEFLAADARPVFVLDSTGFTAAEQSARTLPEHAPADADRVRPLRPDNLAYVIYTSGSTGMPKGVPVPHAAIADHIRGFCAEWGMTAQDRLLASSSVSFDASLLDLFVTLNLGACLVVPKPGAFTDISYVADLIARCGVTVLHTVPALLRTFLTLPGVNQWRALRHVPVGGEALPGEVADRFVRVFDAELRNHYGPTEAVVSATHLTVEGPQGTRIVPIGRPNRNVYLYLLDERLQLVPAGVTGEIYLGGTQLARGYLDRAAGTAERFVADPFGPGRRLYRTGDLARRNEYGELEFLGRADEQVKIRGYRIELGEVSAALASHPSVAQCVAAAVPDPAAGTVLAAYLVPADASGADPDAVRAYAAKTLPEYMIPAAFAVVDEIPRTAHGTLDRRALPTAPAAKSELYREPATAVEIRMAELFGRLFGRDRVGADDSFFDLGGHSLLAARLLARIDTEFGVRIAVRVLFDNPTVSALAALVEAGGSWTGAME